MENNKSKKYRYTAMVKLIFVSSKILFFLFVVSNFISCSEKKNDKQQSTNENIEKDISKNDTATIRKDSTKLTDFFKDYNYLSVKTDSIFNALSEGERVSQMIITSYGELGKSKEHVTKLVSGKKIGGVVILKGESSGLKEQVNYLKNIAKQTGSIPLIFSCDAEPSLFNSKLRNSPKVILASNIKNEKESAEVSLKINSFIKELGFQQNYAPVCDFNINKEIIGNRSFGNDVAYVTELSKKFINICQEQGIVATAKHFPGHGTVNGDSHNSIVFIDGELKELEVFTEVIKNGVISVMVGHIAIKNNNNYNTDGIPSTLSRKIVTDLLKTQLGFKGIIITDAMNMGAVINFTTPSLNAVKAGCDLILMPTNEIVLHDSILAQMKNDEGFTKQIHESVKKIIRLKICLGLL